MECKILKYRYRQIIIHPNKIQARYQAEDEEVKG